MLYIDSQITDPYFNLAFEEYFLKNSSKECFFLWRNRPAVILGKNQNAYSEINLNYVKENDIPVVRRITGGGAVFHDLGNINFTFISNNPTNTFADFRRFTAPIIDALKELSINAELSGRNDLTIDGLKFSGNAQCKFKNRIMHHGTLLFSSNMKNLSEALNPRPIKFQGKGVQSVVSRITNIDKHLKSPMDVTEFKSFLMKFVMSSDENAALYELTNDDINNINKLMTEKYMTWEWNFGSSPKFNLTNEKKFDGGIVEVNLNVEKGYIKEIKFFGDFFGQKDIKEIEDALTGTKHSEDDVYKILSDFDINSYFSNITIDNLIELMF